MTSMPLKRSTPRKRQPRRPRDWLRALKEAIMVLTSLLGVVKLVVEIIRLLP